MKSLNQEMAAIESWCLEWHMRPNPKKIQSMEVSRFLTYTPTYDDLTVWEGGGGST